ncbi:hypothetical protein PAPYR_6975 [Paratrimastix pyriformis]|uniref:Cyclin N-terminal domain-containing protein n=1 Tax=Paratrimastix pyriformis TaxID=342808 RepID=A0ABQ8UIG2_9EUKA|nr:hypothetical protein PAPYR_6975 [Paratrimastix pyriformis]
MTRPLCYRGLGDPEARLMLGPIRPHRSGPALKVAFEGTRDIPSKTCRSDVHHTDESPIICSPAGAVVTAAIKPIVQATSAAVSDDGFVYYSPIHHTRFPPSDVLRRGVAHVLEEITLPCPPLNPASAGWREFGGDPKMPLLHWIAQLQRVSKMPDSVLIMALCYLEMITEKFPLLQITSVNVHRLFLIGCLVGEKMVEDIVYKNKDWRVIGSKYFSCAQINKMEIELMSLLDWSAWVPLDRFEAMLRRVSPPPSSPTNILG